jgi:hypothetical protein
MVIKNSLHTTFAGRWIGKEGSIPWPPRTPDLTPLNFFFWCFLKNYIYMAKIGNLIHWKEILREASVQVSRDMLQRI